MFDDDEIYHEIWIHLMCFNEFCKRLQSIKHHLDVNCLNENQYFAYHHLNDMLTMDNFKYAVK